MQQRDWPKDWEDSWLRFSCFGATDSELMIGDYNKGLLPGFDRLHLEYSMYSPGERLTTWSPKSYQQESLVRARCEAADIGKV